MLSANTTHTLFQHLEVKGQVVQQLSAFRYPNSEETQNTLSMPEETLQSQLLQDSKDSRIYKYPWYITQKKYKIEIEMPLLLFW